MKNSIAKTLLLLTGVWATQAFPQDFEISANVTLASDYSFRGWSQTALDPTIQGGFDIEIDNGWYVGTWASNVNFGTGHAMELDLYAGYSGAFNEEVSYNLMFIWFEYPHQDNPDRYFEFGGSVSYESFTAGIMLSQEYVAEGGPAFQYPFVDYSFTANEEFTIDFHLGLSITDDDNYFAKDTDSYFDYSVTISRTYREIDLSAALVGTDLEDIDSAEPRLVFSISKSL